jgi:molybdate transport system permease protein
VGVIDWEALRLSLALGVVTTLCLVPLALLVGRWLAVSAGAARPFVEAGITLPLVLPPTVMGFYLLAAGSPTAPLGRLWQALFGEALVFSFSGLVAASVLVNLPFAIQPAARAFEGVGPILREAAAACGQPPWRAFWRVEFPLAWRGVLTGLVLSFAHTLGEFGVVLMVGGAIPGETKTLAISIYDRVQAYDLAGAGVMAGVLLMLSLVAVVATFLLGGRRSVGA